MIVTEDGTGLATATTYAAIEDVTEFTRGRPEDEAWLQASADRQEAALLEATRYLDGTFAWKGQIKINTQALDWPRAFVVDGEGRTVPSDSVPTQVVLACCFLAANGATTPLQAEKTGAPIKSKSVASLSITYAGEGSYSSHREFPEVKTMLQGLYVGGPGGNSGIAVRWS